MRLSLMKTWGGKGRLIKWILSHFPPNYENYTYIETCLAGGSIFLNKKPSIVEVGNDIDSYTMKVWEDCKTGRLELAMLPVLYSKTTFQLNLIHRKNNVGSFPNSEYILRNMSRAGMKKDFAWSKRNRGGKPGDLNAWENKVKQLPLIKTRIKDAIFHCEDILTCLRRYNSSNSFTYIDPPYIQSTRVTKNAYGHEMTDQQHIELVDFLNNEWQGKFLISGYMNSIYNKLKTYPLNVAHMKDVSNNAAQSKKKSKRIEIVWRNY